MPTLVLTDLHYTEKPKTMLRHQVDCVKKILDDVQPTELILMGDLMMHRKPSPTVLLALDETLKHAKKYTGDITIIRGNHDSENKSDDGVTALSLFDRDTSNRGYRCKVVTKFYIDHNKKRIFIPHYEKEETIKRCLTAASAYPDFMVFGHFGYKGCLNSAGDQDFSLKLSDFKNETWLGHIHRPNVKRNVTILGTPYTTNFGECGKMSFYGLLEHGKRNLEEIHHGPRHLCYDIEHLDASTVTFINDPAYNTYLRLYVSRLNSESLDAMVGGAVSDLNVASMDIKYKPVNIDEEQSEYRPNRGLFSINEVILEDYIDKSNSVLDREDLLEGLRLLRDED